MGTKLRRRRSDKLKLLRLRRSLVTSLELVLLGKEKLSFKVFKLVSLSLVIILKEQLQKMSWTFYFYLNTLILFPLGANSLLLEHEPAAVANFQSQIGAAFLNK